MRYPKHPFLLVFTKDYPLSTEFESSIIEGNYFLVGGFNPSEKY